MSRIGKQPIIIPSGVEVLVKGQEVTVKGPKGELTKKIRSNIKIEVKDNQVLVSVENPEDRIERAFWGLFRKLIANMVEGVTEGFSKQLEVNGVGYKVALQGSKLVLHLGFSHPVEFDLPEGISAQLEGNQITISGIDKQLVGDVAANIRKFKKPEPYKGKGVKYVEEVVRRKAGKAAKSTGAQ